VGEGIETSFFTVIVLMDVSGRHWEILDDIEFVEAGHAFIEFFQRIIFTQGIDHRSPMRVPRLRFLLPLWTPEDPLATQRLQLIRTEKEFSGEETKTNFEDSILNGGV